MSWKLACPAALFLGLLMSAVAARAATDFWDNNPGGNWENSANWADNSSPGNFDQVFFELPATYTVTFGGAFNPPAIRGLAVTAGNVTFQKAAAGSEKTLSVTTSTPQVVVVDGSSTTLTLGTAGNPLHLTSGMGLLTASGGTLNVRFGSDVVARDLGSGVQGTIRVDGAGSTLTLGPGQQAVGAFTPGTLIFENGSTGAIAGSLELANAAGPGGGGTVLINSGSSLTLDGNLVLANQNFAGTSAVMRIDGANSALNQLGSSSITIGSAANGAATLRIGENADGGTLSTGSGQLTINPTGSIRIGRFGNSGTLNANGDVMINGGQLHIEGSSSAFNLAAGKMLDVTGGGALSSFNFYTTAPNALYRITGAGSKLEVGGLTLAHGAEVEVSSGGGIAPKASPIRLDVGVSGDGTLVVDGAGSSVTATGGASTFGAGAAANVTFRNGASGVFGEIDLADTDIPGSSATLSVSSGASLTVQSMLNLTTVGGTTSAAVVNINGSNSSITQTGVAGIRVGHSASGAATINIGASESGGTLTTGTGDLAIDATGVVNIGSPTTVGTLNANGNVIVNGGRLQASQNSSFNLAAGKTMMIRNGGTAILEAGHLTSANSVYTVMGAQSELAANGLSIVNGADVNVQTGGVITVTAFMDIANSAGDGSLTVSGSGARIDSFAASVWGAGGAAEVTFSDEATGIFSGAVHLANSSAAGTSADVQVRSGSEVAAGSLRLAAVGGAGASATVTVSDPGTFLVTMPSGNLDVGHSASGSAVIHVMNEGSLSVGPGGATTLNATGTIHIDGGRADLKTLVDNGGVIDFAAGSLEYLGDLTVGADGLLGTNLSLAGNRQLTLSGTTTIEAGRTLELNGGLLSTGSLIANGSFFWDRGALEITGGSVTGLSEFIVPANGELRARGVHALRATSLAGSKITAIGDLTLGSASLPNGFGSAGELAVGSHAVTLLDANDAVFDSLAMVTLGGAGGAGTLTAANGLTLDFGGNIVGVGVIDTPNAPTSPLMNNGHITGVSLAEPITLSGFVKGVGTLDNVAITGTLAPGFSPASVICGSVIYNGVLEIEIGGLIPGSEHDQLNHWLGAGVATLGGILDVQLTGGFVPSAGDAFDIINAIGGIQGSFGAIELPELAPGLLWDVSELETAGVLAVVSAPTIPADFDNDGDVDGDDLVQWQGDFGMSSDSDADNDGDSDGADLLAWQRQLGSGVALSPAATAAPEPGMAGLMALALAAFIAANCRTARNC